MDEVRVDDEITLRPFTVDDAGAIFDLIEPDRGRLSAWLPWVDGVRSVEDERRALASHLSRDPERTQPMLVS